MIKISAIILSSSWGIQKYFEINLFNESRFEKTEFKDSLRPDFRHFIAIIIYGSILTKQS